MLSNPLSNFFNRLFHAEQVGRARKKKREGKSSPQTILVHSLNSCEVYISYNAHSHTHRIFPVLNPSRSGILCDLKRSIPPPHNHVLAKDYFTASKTQIPVLAKAF